MCKICRNENLEGLQYLNSIGCPFLTTIPYIKGLKQLDCVMCPLLTSIPYIEGLGILDCHDCPLLTIIPNIEGLKYLICYNCPLLTDIPNIEGLQKLDCHDCPLLTTVPHIKGLYSLYCNDCPLLTTIPNIEGLEKIKCFNNPLLMYIPIKKDLTYNDNLLKLPFKDCKYLTSKKMDRLYNNIYYLWKSYKLKKYINYLQIHIYSNPRLSYMQYYIENELYDEEEGEASTNQSKLKIGYINNKNELIWYKF
ncbi:MAG: hypothetical protein AABX25_04170 [Nanoarchaeota archaeon]